MSDPKPDKIMMADEIFAKTIDSLVLIARLDRALRARESQVRELVEALERMLHEYECGYPESDRTAEVVNECRVALAKARGEIYDEEPPNAG